MPIPVVCLSCKTKMTAPDRAAGRQAKCPKCGMFIDVPRMPESMIAPPQLAEPDPPRVEQVSLLHPCPDCKKEVSKRATQCPHCGCPLTTLEPVTTGPGLVACKACGSPIAKSAPACPKCGVARPGVATGKLVIIRSATLASARDAVQVFVDGQLSGQVMNGATFTLDVPAGQRTVKVQCGFMSRTETVSIEDGKVTRCETYFSNWGLLGGGLIFKPG